MPDQKETLHDAAHGLLASYARNEDGVENILVGSLTTGVFALCVSTARGDTVADIRACWWKHVKTWTLNGAEYTGNRTAAQIAELHNPRVCPLQPGCTVRAPNQMEMLGALDTSKCCFFHRFADGSESVLVADNPHGPSVCLISTAQGKSHDAVRRYWWVCVDEWKKKGARYMDGTDVTTGGEESTQSAAGK